MHVPILRMETWLHRRQCCAQRLMQRGKTMTSLQLVRAGSAVNVHMDHAVPELARVPRSFIFCYGFSVLTWTGLVLKSCPDSLMRFLSFGTLQESVSKPSEFWKKYPQEILKNCIRLRLRTKKHTFIENNTFLLGIFCTETKVWEWKTKEACKPSSFTSTGL